MSRTQMNNRLLIISNSSSAIADAYDCRKLEYSNQSRDEEIHRWILGNKSSFDDIEKIIIPARLGDEDSVFMGIYIGMHIRLTKELNHLRFLPIAIVSESTKEEILKSQLDNFSEKTALLLFTKGTYLFSVFEIEELFINKVVSSLDETTFREELKSKLVFNVPDRGHDLANEWGAFRLAKYAGLKLSLEKPASLFFKYKDFLSNNETQPSGEGKTILLNQPCKALLIDDHADSGWRECLDYILNNNIFSPGKVKTLATIKTLDEAMKVPSYKDYDLIFLDLRLLPHEDRANELPETTEFSGTKILKRIKDENKGIQVIIFTASNKIWNIQSLIDLGANGYYIKESPEYILSANFSIGNFNTLINAIKKCFTLGYLRNLWEYHLACVAFISTNKQNRSPEYQNFYNRTLVSLEIAFEFLNKSADNQKYLNFAFLTYFQILEDYVKLDENFRVVSETECYVSQNIRIIDEPFHGQRRWMLRYNKQGGGYFEKQDDINPDKKLPETLAKISFVLVFKFNKDDSVLSSFARINFIRNTKAAHGGSNGYVTETEIKGLLDTVRLFLTS
jgi:DNA-binding NarL/FixJ family response regulator